VEFSQAMPALASVTTGTIGIVFGDLKLAAKLGDRRGITVESGFENDDFTKQLMTVLGTQRFDINVHTVVDPKDNSKAGPVIGLKTA
jgi:HK97 family phage major capsid protein